MFHVTINLCAKPCLPGWEKGEPQGPREKQRRGWPGCGQPAWRATLRRWVCHQERAKPSTGSGGTANSGVASIQRWHLPFIQSTCSFHRYRHELSAEMCVSWVMWPRSHHPPLHPPPKRSWKSIGFWSRAQARGGGGMQSTQESWGLESQRPATEGSMKIGSAPLLRVWNTNPQTFPKVVLEGEHQKWTGKMKVGIWGSRYRASSTQRPALDWGP